MKALLIADLHGSQNFLNTLKKIISDYDLVLCAGDLTDFGRPEDYFAELSKIIATKPFYWVSGNNDVGQNYQYQLGNLINIDGRIVEFQGLKLAGMGGSAPNYEGQNYGPTLNYSSDLSGVILLTHIPPSRRLEYSKSDIKCSPDSKFDTVEASISSNNLAIKQFRNAPRVHLCGHIHNIYGAACLGETKIVKIGTAKNGQYAEMDLDDLSVRFLGH